MSSQSPRLSIDGCVFDDRNADGIALQRNADGSLSNRREAGIDGVRVKAVDLNGNVVATTTTRYGGFYEFFNLPVGGQYKLRFDYSNVPGLGDRILSPANVVDPALGSGSELKDSDAVRLIRPGVAETDIITVGTPSATKVNAGLAEPSNPGDPRTAFIGNRVFADTNGNGVQDAGEGGVGGVRITLTEAGNDGVIGTGDDTSRTQTTGNSGFYGFNNLAAGDYQLSFDQLPQNAEFTRQNVGNDSRDSDIDPTTGRTDIIRLAAGEFNRDVDAGVVQGGGPVDPGTGFIGNRVFADTNGNGVQDPGEGGVGGVRVTLTGAGADGRLGTGDDTQRSQTTGSNGFYGFNNLEGGDYEVSFSNLPQNAQFTQPNVGNDAQDSDVNPNTGRTGTIRLAPGEFNRNVDAGVVQGGGPVDPGTGFIGNRVFDDANRNGVQDPGEGGVGGVRVTLTGAGADGRLGTGDDTQRSQTTGSNGFYGFNNLEGGDYEVSFSNLPQNAQFTQPNVGNDAQDSDVNPNTGRTGTIRLAPGEFNRNVDAGVVQGPTGPTDPNNAVIGNRIFDDRNGNGIQDPGEGGVGGVRVTLAEAGNDGVVGTPDDVIRSQTTGNDGFYGFNNLPGGDYKVTVSNIGNRGFSPANQGNDALDSDINPANGMTDVFRLAPSEINNTVDAGLAPATQPTGSIGDRVFNDLNGNGQFNPGEGLNGLTVTLDRNNDGTIDDSTTTGPDGQYRFNNLQPGTYKVNVVNAPGNLNPTVDLDGVNDGMTTVTVAPGQVRADVDFGYQQPAPQLGSIGDRVFNDLNGNGQFNPGEGLGGITVTLDQNNDGTIDFSTTSGADGFYRFDSLQPGTYKVNVANAPGNLVPTVDPDAVNDGMTTLTLGGGQNLSVVDFGFAAPTPQANPGINIEKFAVPLQGNICNVLGDTAALTFTYTLGSSISNRQGGLASVSGSGDNDPNGFLVFRNTNTGLGKGKSKSKGGKSKGGKSKGKGGSLFSQSIRQGDAFTITGDIAPDTTIEIYESEAAFNSGQGPLQTVNYHTSCSQDIQLNDQIGSLRLTGYTGTLGSASVRTPSNNNPFGDVVVFSNSGGLGKSKSKSKSKGGKSKGGKSKGKGGLFARPGSPTDIFTVSNGAAAPEIVFEPNPDGSINPVRVDADTAAAALDVITGTRVGFEYLVSNTGDTPLSVQVTDDRLGTPRFTGGDVNRNGLLDLSETWTYAATETVQAGLTTNLGTALGTAVNAQGSAIAGLAPVSDSDAANYIGITPGIPNGAFFG